MQKLERAGRLTPEQSAKIQPRVEAAVKQMQSIQIQAMQQGSDALDAALAEIETGLNPDQQKRLERFRERRRAFLQEAISRKEGHRQQTYRRTGVGNVRRTYEPWDIVFAAAKTSIAQEKLRYSTVC